MRRLYIPLLAVVCVAGFSAAAQQAAQVTPATGQSAHPKPSTERKEKPAFADDTRVSTAEAARHAAKDLTKAHGHDTAPEASATPDVLEFHAADPAGQGSTAATITSSKESKKSALKKIHGDVYGALGGPGTGSQTGGSVGATTKSGKSSIYVETDRSRETTPAPH